MKTLQPSSEGGDGSIRVKCADCGAELLAEPGDAGKQGACPDCGRTFIIASPPPPPPPASAPEKEPAAPPEKPKLSLKDEPSQREPAPAPSAEGPIPWQPRPGPLVAPADDAPPEGHESRAKLAGWLRRVVLVVAALCLVEVFDAACAAVRMAPPAGLREVVGWTLDFAATLPGRLDLLRVPRSVETLRQFGALDRFAVAIAILTLLARLVVRCKLLDAIYVTTPRWAERSHAGLVFHSLALFLQTGLLAWAASAAKTADASDGMACGLLALYLFMSALWLAALHLVSTDEYHGLGAWAVTDAAFALAITWALLWPESAPFWTRAGATVILCLANSVLALHLGASFIFARRPRGWWWRKPLFLLAGCAIVLAVAVLLAIVR